MTALASTAAGVAVGGTTGAGTALNEVANNYLKHAEVADMIRILDACKARNCSDKEQEDILGYYRNLSASRNYYDLTKPEIAADVLAGEQHMATYLQSSGSFRINSTISKLFGIDKQQADAARNVPTVQAAPTTADTLARVKAENYQGQQAQNLLESLPVAGAIASPELLLTLGVSKPVVGAIAAGGFDAFGQLTDPNRLDYRYWQTVSNAATGAVVFSLGGKYWLLDGALGAAVNGTNTAVTNAVYGRKDNVQDAIFWGGVFGAAGNLSGRIAGEVSSPFVPRVVYPNGFNGKVSVLLQQSVLNPLPGYINTGFSTAVGGVPTLVQGYMPASPLLGGAQP